MSDLYMHTLYLLWTEINVDANVAHYTYAARNWGLHLKYLKKTLSDMLKYKTEKVRSIFH